MNRTRSASGITAADANPDVSKTGAVEEAHASYHATKLEPVGG